MTREEATGWLTLIMLVSVWLVSAGLVMGGFTPFINGWEWDHWVKLVVASVGTVAGLTLAVIGTVVVTFSPYEW